MLNGRTPMNANELDSSWNNTDSYMLQLDVGRVKVVSRCFQSMSARWSNNLGESQVMTPLEINGFKVARCGSRASRYSTLHRLIRLHITQLLQGMLWRVMQSNVRIWALSLSGNLGLIRLCRLWTHHVQTNWIRNRNTLKDKSCFNWLMQCFTLSPSKPSFIEKYSLCSAFRGAKVLSLYKPFASASLLFLETSISEAKATLRRSAPTTSESWFIDKSSQQLDWFPSACESQGIFN